MCIKHQLNEIIEILKDNNISNIIASISAIIALGALIVTIVSNIKNNKRYINSLKPLLSFEFYQINGMLVLAVKNTGMTEATKIKLKIKKIKNNGDNNKLMLDDLFKSEFMLYPTEEVQGIIGIYGERIDKEVFPMLEIDISYIQGNDNKDINYSRTISFKKNIKVKAGAKVRLYYAIAVSYEYAEIEELYRKIMSNNYFERTFEYEKDQR